MNRCQRKITPLIAVALLLGLSVPVRGAVLAPGHSMVPGQMLTSMGGRYFATLLPNGDLVVLCVDGRTIWTSGTRGSGAVALTMQHDGNLVLTNSAGAHVWSTGTHGKHRVFGVSRAGQAMVLNARKWRPRDNHAEPDVDLMQFEGSVRTWEAAWDGPPSRPRPHGGHCVGDPRACGNAGQPINPIGITIPF